MKHFKHIVALTVLLIFCTPLVIDAQVIKHKVTPRVIDKQVSQRDIFTETITVENLAPHKVSIYPTVNAVAVDEGGDITDFAPQSMSDNKVTVTSWLAISRAAIELLPGEVANIPLEVKIHPQAESGVYHAFIGFGTGRNRDIAQQQADDGLAPGVIVTLTVGKDEVKAIKLDNFLVKRFITSQENNAITYTLQNPGSVAVVPSGEIIISSNTGQEVATVDVNPEGISLEIGESKTYTTHMPIVGLLGKYKAFLNVDYGTDQVASVYDTAFFYVIPWKQLLIFFAVFSIIVILVTVYLHRRYQDDDDDSDGAHYVPLYVKGNTSEAKDHDINLKS